MFLPKICSLIQQIFPISRQKFHFREALVVRGEHVADTRHELTSGQHFFLESQRNVRERQQKDRTVAEFIHQLFDEIQIGGETDPNPMAKHEREVVVFESSSSS